MNRTDGQPRNPMGSIKAWVANIPTGVWTPLPPLLNYKTFRATATNCRVSEHLVTRLNADGRRMVFKLPPLP